MVRESFRRAVLSTVGLLGLSVLQQSCVSVDRGPSGSEIIREVNTQGEILFNKDAIHPLQRDSITPGCGVVLNENTPSFIWPSVYEDDVEFENIAGALYPTRQHDVVYAVKLSQDPAFPQGCVSKGKPWSFYNQLKPLAVGKWYWQYGASVKGGEYHWSERFEFSVSDTAASYAKASVSELLNKVPADHPRLLTTARDLKRIRTLYAQTPEKIGKFLKEADAVVGMAIPKESVAIPPEKKMADLSEEGKRRMRINAAKDLAKKMGSEIGRLVHAYLLTGDEKYGESAVQWAVRTAGFEHHGPACFTHFADGRHMRNMALVYDSCHSLLSKEEKEAVLGAIKIRAAAYYDEWVNGLENITNSGHVWQQLHMYFLLTSLATYRDLPEASEWLEYAYGVYMAKAPALSDKSDGAWANGTNYMSANQFSLIVDAITLSNVTGYNYLENPWFSNNSWYMIYSTPVNGTMPGFADSYEKYPGEPKTIQLLILDYLARTQKQGHAGWYTNNAFTANKTLKTKTFRGNGDFLDWYVKLWALEGAPEGTVDKAPEYPNSRCFKEVGVVAMHDSVTDVGAGNSLFFKSGPFGSVCNHAFSSNNAFNLAVEGKKLFYSAGYRGIDDFYGRTDGANTVLIDGKPQLRGGVGYGWISRFIGGDKVAFTVGDASNAYKGTTNKMVKILKPDTADYVDHGLTRFRRSVASLGDGLYVIYDNLAADHAAQWSWLLNTRGVPVKKDSDGNLKVNHSGIVSKVNIYSNSEVDVVINDHQPQPSIDYLANSKKKNNFEKQYCVRVENCDKMERVRFMAVIQAGPTGYTVVEPKKIFENQWKVGNWIIRAELDSAKPQNLQAINDRTATALSAHGQPFVLKGKTIEHGMAGSSLLIEKGEIVDEVIDLLPKAAR